MPETPPTIEVLRRALEPQETLPGLFDAVRVRPFGETAWAYGLLVPRGFAADAHLAPRPSAAPLEPVKIGAFRSPDGDAVDVARMVLGRDVSLADVLADQAERFGLSLAASAAIEVRGREAADAVARWTGPGGAPKITRLLLFREHDAVVRVSGTADAARFAALAPQLAVSLATFAFEAPRPSAFLEPHVYTAHPGATTLGLRHPASWRVEERRGLPYGRQGLDLRRIDGGEVSAVIRAFAVVPGVTERASREELAREALESLRAFGYEPGPLVARSTPPPPSGAFGESTLSLVHAGRALGGDGEARVTVLESDYAHYTLAALLPGRERDRLGWMTARRAYETALVTLNRPDDDLLSPEAYRRRAEADAEITDRLAAAERERWSRPAEERFDLDVEALEDAAEEEERARFAAADEDDDEGVW